MNSVGNMQTKTKAKKLDCQVKIQYQQDDLLWMRLFLFALSKFQVLTRILKFLFIGWQLLSSQVNKAFLAGVVP